MDAPNFVFILALVTIVIALGWGLFSYFRAKSARDKRKTSAMGEDGNATTNEPVYRDANK